MEIRHFKFDQIDSTQLWIKENISNHSGEHLLVTTAKQSQGVGRQGSNWSQFGKSLAFSFSIPPCDVLTLTPLEVGVQLINFFKEKGAELVLKWPNDILLAHENRLKKVGGIICHYSDKETLLVGIGLNLEQGAIPSKLNYKFPPAGLNLNLKQYQEYCHELPEEIFKSFLSHRLNSKEVISAWNESCSHLNMKVKVVDGKSSIEGTFKGIGANGEALIQNQSGLQKVVSGSLWILG